MCETEVYDTDEPTEEEWLRFVMSGGAFDELADPREDIYTLEDGKPIVAGVEISPHQNRAPGRN
jgi:hypothetical protein